MALIRWGIIGVGDVTEVKSGPAFQKASNSELVAVMRRTEHLAEDTIALDVSEMSSWTDYFIISTVRSQTHLRSLLDRLRSHMHLKGLKIPIGRKSLSDEGWTLIDGGDFVIHLMERDKRDFYELEKLWFKSKTVYQSPDQSSNSS